MKWKVAIMGSTGVVVNTPAFRLLYPFPSRGAAEAHAECFRIVGMKVEVRNVTAPQRER